MDNKPAPAIHDLFPGLNPEELKSAEETLDRYLALVLGIFERSESEQARSNAGGNLTGNNGTLA